MRFRAQPQPARPQSGFTLIELLIAIVVVGLIAALAFPSFMDSVRKSRRAEAYAALSAVQLKQERWRTNNATYTNSLTGSWPATGTPEGLGLLSSTPSNYYNIAIVSNDATSYEATATAVAGSSQARDGDCVKLGVKMTSGNISYGSAAANGSLAYAASNRCWGR